MIYIYIYIYVLLDFVGGVGTIWNHLGNNLGNHLVPILFAIVGFDVVFFPFHHKFSILWRSRCGDWRCQAGQVLGSTPGTLGNWRNLSLKKADRLPNPDLQ